MLAQHSARTTHVVVAVEEARASSDGCAATEAAFASCPASHPTVSLTLIAALRRGDAVALAG